jgi:hypothetical protein
MCSRANKVIIHFVAMIAIFWGDVTQATLNTYVQYYPCGGGNECQVTQTPLTATSANNSPISVGDNNGGANGRSDYGVLNGSASGSWLGGNIPSLVSSGYSTSQFEDMVTLSGGSGSVEVTVALHLEGEISDAATNTNGSGIIQPTVYFNGMNQFAQLFLYQTVGGGEVDLVNNVTATWVSQNGTFTLGNHGGVFPVSANGTLTLVVNLPYNTSIPIGVRLGVEGNHSVTSTARTTLTLSVPEGTTITSTANVNYAATPTKASVPTLPELAFWILFGILGLIGIIISKSKFYN